MNIINNKWFIKIWIIALIILILYLIWLWLSLYNRFVEIDDMYSDSYNKRLEIEGNVNRIKSIRLDKEF